MFLAEVCDIGVGRFEISRHEAEQDCLSAIAFALEGNPADYDPTAEALTLDVTVAPAA